MRVVHALPAAVRAEVPRRHVPDAQGEAQHARWLRSDAARLYSQLGWLARVSVALAADAKGGTQQEGVVSISALLLVLTV